MQANARGPQQLLREYAFLNRKRKGEGVTPLEYQRWLAVREQLERTFPERPAPGGGGPVRMRLDYATAAVLVASVMWNVRPIGLFVHTPFAPEEGTELDARICVKETGEEFGGAAVVVSNNLGPGFSTDALGMGLRFTAAGPRERLAELCREHGRG